MAFMWLSKLFELIFAAILYYGTTLLFSMSLFFWQVGGQYNLMINWENKRSPIQLQKKLVYIFVFI